MAVTVDNNWRIGIYKRSGQSAPWSRIPVRSESPDVEYFGASLDRATITVCNITV